MSSYIRIISLSVLITIISACGGGGSSSSATRQTGTGPSDEQIEAALMMASTGPMVATSIADAATRTPVAGSVTQSSASSDRVSADATYSDGNLTINIMNSGTGSSWSTIGSNDTTFPVRRDTVTGTAGVPYQEHALLKVNVPNILMPNFDMLAVGAYTNRVNADDTDYLVFGGWQSFNAGISESGDISINNLQIGAFADGPDAMLTPSSYLTTDSTATYRGDFLGAYTSKNPNTGALNAGSITGDINLTASFETTPTIRGTVTDFEITPILDSDQPGSIDGSLTLDTATITNTDGGFFTGNTSASETVESKTYTYSGKWGGQFYGTEADYIGGTFGANADIPTEDDAMDTSVLRNAVGAFGAYKQ